MIPTSAPTMAPSPNPTPNPTRDPTPKPVIDYLRGDAELERCAMEVCNRKGKGCTTRAQANEYLGGIITEERRSRWDNYGFGLWIGSSLEWEEVYLCRIGNRGAIIMQEDFGGFCTLEVDDSARGSMVTDIGPRALFNGDSCTRTFGFLDDPLKTVVLVGENCIATGYQSRDFDGLSISITGPGRMSAYEFRSFGQFDFDVPFESIPILSLEVQCFPNDLAPPAPKSIYSYYTFDGCGDPNPTYENAEFCGLDVGYFSWVGCVYRAVTDECESGTAYLEHVHGPKEGSYTKPQYVDDTGCKYLWFAEYKCAPSIPPRRRLAGQPSATPILAPTAANGICSTMRNAGDCLRSGCEWNGSVCRESASDRRRI